MKKGILICLFFSVFSVGAFAQHRAIGARLSSTLEASYQREAGSSNFWEFDGGLWMNGCGTQASAVYNWIVASPHWAPKGEWNWYVGVGGGLGVIWGNAYHQGAEDVGCYVGVAGMVGLEYTFWFPLQVSADFRPIVGPYFGDGVSFNTSAFLNAFWPTVSVRYRF